MQWQWHLFPLQLISMLLAFTSYRRAGIILMLITLFLALICLDAHMTDPLNINL